MTIIFPGGGGSGSGGGSGGDLVIEGSTLIGVLTSGNTAKIWSRSYVHEQGVSSDTWVIQHNLNKYPDVVLVDSAGTVFRATCTYNSLNKCTIYINGATTGKAFLN